MNEGCETFGHMASDVQSSAVRRRWNTAAQIVLSLATIAGIVLWALVAFALLVLRCGDGCSGDQASDWKYTGQALLAGTGLALGVVSVVLGFTQRRDAFWLAFALASMTALAWCAWVLDGGF